MTPIVATPFRLTGVTWLVVSLAAVDFGLKPERAWHWLLAMALMLGMRVVVRARPRSRWSEAKRRALVEAAVLGGLILAAALAVALLRSVGLDHGWASDRVLGIVVGFALLAMGNAIPKASVAPTASTCVHGTYATRRFAGWMFAGAGAIGLSGWLFAPVEEAQVIATVACFSAVALVLVRCVADPAAKAAD